MPPLKLNANHDSFIHRVNAIIVAIISGPISNEDARELYIHLNEAVINIQNSLDELRRDYEEIKEFSNRCSPLTKELIELSIEEIRQSWDSMAENVYGMSRISYHLLSTLNTTRND